MYKSNYVYGLYMSIYGRHKLVANACYDFMHIEYEIVEYCHYTMACTKI